VAKLLGNHQPLRMSATTTEVDTPSLRESIAKDKEGFMKHLVYRKVNRL
jgi:hypothetical protein